MVIARPRQRKASRSIALNLRKIPQTVYILGVERSGSTWLANIFDSAPSTIFFMEPFSSYAEIFEGLDRLLYWSDCNESELERLRDSFDQLYDAKYFGWERHDSSPLVRRATAALLELHAAVSEVLLARPRADVERYRELNLNRKSNPEVYGFRKQASPQAAVIKELRLNFKIAALARLQPNSRFLVIIRNPVSQIGSMLRLFEKDKLHELRRTLSHFAATAAEMQRFSRYREVLEELDADNTVEMAVAYWFLNYATLIEDLESRGCDFQVIKHEELCERPSDVTNSIFEWCGLDFGPQTQKYIEVSSRSDHAASSAVDTSRDSKHYYKKVFRRVDEQTKDTILRTAEKFWRLDDVQMGLYESLLNSPNLESQSALPGTNPRG